MNRLWKPGPTPLWFTAVLILTLLATAAAQAEPAKRPAAALSAAGGTISTSLACLPGSGTLPMNILISCTTYNATGTPRACFGRVDLRTAGGWYIASISSGVINLPAGVGEFVQVGWFKPLPARIEHVGTNRYIFTVTDITAPPFNEPPFPPDGTVAMQDCEVTGIIP